MMEVGEVHKEHCNKCLGYKNQEIVHIERTSWTEVVDEAQGLAIDGGDQWTLFRCLGCDAVRLKHQDWFSEHLDEYGRPAVNTEWFPPSVKRQKPIWRRSFTGTFSSKLHAYDELSDEIYEALAIGAHRLAAMGVRALVERLMIEEVGDQGNFQKNIEAFFSAGHVALNQQAMFEDTLIEAGHAAMHRNFEPSADTVNTLLDIVEGIMHSIYYAPLTADKVKRTIPKRS